ncbi:FAD:protein FMN transferase [Halorhodospira halophila]|uniref:FAD:protein FMN transferase n=1 Tax=Halorhodospira halophila (strain DSM 244 / SL1) TaxID=349124 RepID=A1WVK0_HALHL|nr:FAD:protein FMN transferase [Halorhodospira halophila]ABM61712.1 ApbE family lipoprotein [Halorhodospira halophila SL1]MBK1728958.1 FAD:protein FMN transferase [Halorhodospira halophila]
MRCLASTTRALALAALATALGLTGCTAEPDSTRLQFISLGTEVEIHILDAGSGDAETAAKAARQEIDAISEAWEPTRGTELGPLNERLAAGEGMQVSEELIAILERAREMEARTGGRFSPAIGGLTELWGFSAQEGPLEEPPPAEEIEAWVERAPRIADLSWDAERRVTSSNDGVRIDLGGIGKGFAGERAVAALREHGVRTALISLGGDLVALGAPDDRPWRMGVRDPRAGTVLAAVEAHADETVFTSGDYERTFTHEDRRYHHILDPTTGYPAMGSRSMTVIHDDPVHADAAATALFIAGPDDWQALAEELEIGYALLVDRDGAVWMTEAMAERVELQGEPEAVHIE